MTAVSGVQWGSVKGAWVSKCLQQCEPEARALPLLYFSSLVLLPRA